MHTAFIAFLIILGLGQLASTYWGLRALSLAGPSRLAGYGLGMLLLSFGALMMPHDWTILWWTLPASLLSIALLLWGGNIIAPPPHPDQLFSPDHPAHAGCYAVEIPDGDFLIPGLLLYPSGQSSKAGLNPRGRPGGPAVCLVPGAGDTKIFFKWRLVKTLLAAGLIVLTIDPPGHGDYRHRPLTYPDCLSAIPAALTFLKQQPGVTQVGLIGISLGGALSLASLAQTLATEPHGDRSVAALVIIATPTRLTYNRVVFYRELWNTIYGAPVLSLFREINLKQILQSWYSGGYRSRHSTAELIDLLNPLGNIKKFTNIPTLMVYSRRDRVSPPQMAHAIQRAAPWAKLVESKKASHVMLTLIPSINQQVACWLREQLTKQR